MEVKYNSGRDLYTMTNDHIDHIGNQFHRQRPELTVILKTWIVSVA